MLHLSAAMIRWRGCKVLSWRDRHNVDKASPGGAAPINSFFRWPFAKRAWVDGDTQSDEETGDFRHPLWETSADSKST